MKNILYTILLPALLIIASCKKEDTTPDNTNKGLESLVNPSAENYCVLVIDDFHGNIDTVVWQNTVGDTTWGNRSSYADGMSSPTIYYYSANQVMTPKVAGKFEKVQISFRMKIAAMQVSYPCSYIDSVVKPGGAIPVTKDNLFLELTDNFGLGMSTLNTSDDVMEVLAATKLTTMRNGCNEVRTKFKLTNIQFGPFGCIVPPYKITEGIVQLDY